MHAMDEEYSNMNLMPSNRRHDRLANESSATQVTVNRELIGNQPRGVAKIKARKVDKESYKSIMKKTTTKVMEQTTDYY
ncbi:hypothetical protein HanRHA438_Chr08g0360131 [Helianthus annuus]|uniref:Uncharacterized protein n=1 Tax=Helianthus annuus TaxID=4232 RepID=A0A251U7B3_HELAN|nr:hypothetical protein HanXRQr2_Chr08g0347851 [Helianthus annuus]KAJ0554242.1 hypothetical protein HanHA89_Chr08g0305471 [Helianthus annuus]KAJ0898730.1 hypothetical protein HanRHA438_Chr08g0360131 [Helianthus annuus]KAJ0902363.1 hypothetical protein HanPSC8_Chr08g0336121 [Helianthus annuus]